MTRVATRLSTALVAFALLMPASAFGHAQLEETSPERGAVVKDEPAAVSFRFDEAVEGNFGAARVYDAKGERVDAGDAFHPAGDDRRLAVHLKPDLHKGSYTATYRVVSADGHVVAGGFVFSVGRPGVAPRETVAELIAGAAGGPATQAAFGIARGLQYLAVALAVGSLAFLLLAWLPGLGSVSGRGEGWADASPAFSRRLKVGMALAAMLGALSAAAGVVLEGAEAAGVSVFSALTEPIVRETLGTRFGMVWGACALAWLVFGALLFFLGRGGLSSPRLRRVAIVLALPLVVVVLEPALSGHASTQSPRALLLPANVLHVVAMGVWLGGLAALLFAVPAGTRTLTGGDRSRLLAAVLGRFSSVALIAVGAILLTGLAQAVVYIGDIGNLLATGYGRAVSTKLFLLLFVVGVGAYNRRRSLPRLRWIAAGGEPPGRAGAVLRRALRAEVALLVVVLGVTAALAAYAPPTSARPGPFSTSASLGPAQLELTVDPARVGANQLHLYFFDSKTGAQFTGTREVGVTASLPDKGIGPLPLDPQASGPGHYTVPDAQLAVAGDWRLEVTLRVSAFDQYEKKIEVPIR